MKFPHRTATALGPGDTGPKNSLQKENASGDYRRAVPDRSLAPHAGLAVLPPEQTSLTTYQREGPMNTTPKSTESEVPRQALAAQDLMTRNPVSIRENATLHEAVALLVDKGFSAAPVIDNAGRAVGVISQRDVLVHDREKVDYLEPVPADYDTEFLGERVGKSAGAGFQVVAPDSTLVSDIMTPMVFSVAPDCPAQKVVDQMLAMKFHRLFVIDDNGVLIGVISALDILKRVQF
jgi:CBS domain-containing protein